MITRGIFKANDIRGVTEGPDPQWDTAGAYAIGAALVDTLDLNAAEGALVVGRDMRVSGPAMSAAFIDGVLSRGADVVDIGLASTDQLWFASGAAGPAGGDVHRQPQPGGVQRDQVLPGRGPADRPGPAGRDRRPGAGGSRCPAAARGSAPSPTCSRVRGPPALPGRPDRDPPADRGRGRRQRDGRAHPPRRCSAGRPGGDRALHRSRRHVPQPPAQPARAGEPGRRPGRGVSSTAPTWPWSSTATPTGASSSTSAARWSPRRR